MVKPGEQYIRHYFETEQHAERIYDVLTSNQFSRSKPTLPIEIKENLREELIDSVGSCGLKYFKISSLLGLWGGSKENESNTADAADIITLDNICALRDKIINSAGGTKLEPTLLFCDLHHIVSNNRSLEETDTYFDSLSTLAEERDMKLKRLSDIYKMTQLNYFYIPLAYISNKESRKKAAEICSNKETFEELIEAAQKHSQWVKQKIFKPQQIAKLYVEMELFFLNYIKSENKGRTIFFSYSDPKIQKPIAEAAGVPMLYFHSNCPEPGFNECPWYVNMPEKLSTSTTNI